MVKGAREEISLLLTRKLVLAYQSLGTCRQRTVIHCIYEQVLVRQIMQVSGDHINFYYSMYYNTGNIHI